MGRKNFLYFEAQDFAKRLKIKTKEYLFQKAINTYHIGASSHDKKLDVFSRSNRNWHYNWSRFYFNKNITDTYMLTEKGFHCYLN